ncbi:nitroreductase/quinone reductase family protein [Mangrovihabitans endophyticus]|uniref:Nitroreductase n=1 Tax=Mangrovihabitans endophyticus TaxID=1751298 RepID=A0A8J3FMR9_9ACTN|nr:nitroreductase/quinone reductase family protein [Mangrovihabitans endophyticus]GGK75386.1 nitroreductase [Mangrovihabitans endophyticus]
MVKTLPPRWFVRTAWVAHKALLGVTRDRVGLSAPARDGKFGMLRLHTVGRKSGKPRAVVLGYIEDGDNLVTLAMNGWAPPDPGWWLNLKARPEATVDMVSGRRAVHAREAVGDERARLWAELRRHSGYGELDALAARRGRETAVVVLVPSPPS